jgi:hypothetical protein
LSYAAIFGIQEDLNLHGTQYNWLSSIFYFGFLVWAIPTNFMLQRFPVGEWQLLHKCLSQSTRMLIVDIRQISWTQHLPMVGIR